jgi:hypothetical protein
VGPRFYVIIKKMLIEILFVAGMVAGEVPYEVFNKTNHVFESMVYGSSNHTFWEYVDTLHSQPTARGSEFVALLNNTFNYKLSLHHIIVGTDGAVESHTMPRTEEAPTENETISKAADFKEIDGFEILDYTEQ